MDHLTDLNNMYLFAKVVDHGGFTAAAQVLGLQTSKLSRRVAALEAELGVRLLNRNSRRVSLTDAGRLFYQHCVALVEEARAAKTAIDQTRASPQGVVRISSPLGVLQMGAREILTQYMVDNPAVRIMLDATNRRVDIIEEGLDIALRVRLLPLEDSDLTLLPLLDSRRILVASPALLAQHPALTDLDDLAGMPTLAMANTNDKYQWHFLAPHPVVFSHQPRLATDDLETLRAAALRGIGIAQLPANLVQDDLARGRLLPVLPERPSPAGSLHAIFPSRRGMVPAVRGVLDALLAGFNPQRSQNTSL
ncbi:LysR family transcriptional regulator [Pseudomonas gingeri]|uniref:LysR substrate-binding domain-containing protein n=1 Tax=Pseudomonas gingeri TaxID=117681 RepID=UPI0015A1CFCC|nr:LysR substrate-binding domain-containing protein [Pseudomonas gingeri]NVZ64053.1 LysR family transcriptional regulator [Pseudomonas gingeri]NVZ78719.1 LysR family transcriptional regulator [Pseudomonas gingeri]